MGGRPRVLGDFSYLNVRGTPSCPHARTPSHTRLPPGAPTHSPPPPTLLHHLTPSGVPSDVPSGVPSGVPTGLPPVVPSAVPCGVQVTRVEDGRTFAVEGNLRAVRGRERVPLRPHHSHLPYVPPCGLHLRDHHHTPDCQPRLCAELRGSGVQGRPGCGQGLTLRVRGSTAGTPPLFPQPSVHPSPWYTAPCPRGVECDTEGARYKAGPVRGQGFNVRHRGHRNLALLYCTVLYSNAKYSTVLYCTVQ